MTGRLPVSGDQVGIVTFNQSATQVAPLESLSATNVTNIKNAINGTNAEGQPAFDGRLTANGETYDMEKLAAAHRSFPFGTVVRVENLASNKTVDVRINDRGPFVDGRVVDLSYSAAQSLGMIEQGVAKVHLAVVQ